MPSQNRSSRRSQKKAVQPLTPNPSHVRREGVALTYNTFLLLFLEGGLGWCCGRGGGDACGGGRAGGVGWDHRCTALHFRRHGGLGGQPYGSWDRQTERGGVNLMRRQLRSLLVQAGGGVNSAKRFSTRICSVMCLKEGERKACDKYNAMTR